MTEAAMDNLPTNQHDAAAKLQAPDPTVTQLTCIL
jgi:hypothetical protein